MEEDVGARGHQPGDQIEDQIGDVAESIFDVVPEDEQHPHVGQQVDDRTVEEDRGEDREPDVLLREHRLTIGDAGAAADFTRGKRLLQ